MWSHITQRAQYAAAIAEKTLTRARAISARMKNSSPDYYEKVIAAATTAGEIAEKIRASARVATAPTLTDAAEIYQLMALLTPHVSAMQAFSTHPQWYNPDMRARDDIARLSRDYFAEDATTIPAILAGLSLGEDAIDFILACPYVNEFTTAVMRQLMEDPTSAARLAPVIESQKDALLGATRRPLDTAISRCGLRPSTQFMTLPELLAAIGSDSLEGSHSVVLDRPTSIWFNLDGVLNREYIIAEELDIKAETGLNKRVLKKFNTIRLLAPTASAWTPATEVTTYGEIDKITHCIEHSTGWFRLLALRGVGTTITSAIARGLIEPSTRPTAYNGIAAAEILARCVDPSAAMRMEKYNADSLIDPVRIKSTILAEALSGFDAAGVDSVEALFSYADQAIGAAVTVAMSRLLVSTSAEAVLGWIARYYDITEKFTRETSSALETIDLRGLHGLRSDDMTKTLRDICAQAVTMAINKLDKNAAWRQPTQTARDHVIAGTKLNI